MLCLKVWDLVGLNDIYIYIYFVWRHHKVEGQGHIFVGLSVGDNNNNNNNCRDTFLIPKPKMYGILAQWAKYNNL